MSHTSDESHIPGTDFVCLFVFVSLFSSITLAAAGFFFFNFAKIELSLSGKGGISSNTVANMSPFANSANYNNESFL